MNRYTDAPQPNKWIMRGILTALQPYNLDDFDQREGDLYWDADDQPIDNPKCPVCVSPLIATWIPPLTPMALHNSPSGTAAVMSASPPPCTAYRWTSCYTATVRQNCPSAANFGQTPI